ncbi:MAG: hypothetical protein H8D38_05965 [DPANN group archaeon]|nr:hypothetical protein [DPANN group archaeon]
MYDILETEISFEILKKIVDECKKIKIGLIGGWATYSFVNDNYKKAFGIEYLRSRDIDIFVDSKDTLKFRKIIEKLGFEKSAYYFRYELIYDREEKKFIKKNVANKKQIYNLIYVFLDVFSNKKSKLDAWIIEELSKAKLKVVSSIPLVDIKTLLKLKSFSLFEREKLDKELKDGCDLYALLMYSEEKIILSQKIKKAIEKIMKRNDLCEFIAENVLKDMLKVGIVKATLRSILRKDD